MSIPIRWSSVIADNHAVRSIEQDIYSVLSDGPHQHLYDRRAAIYDLVVGTGLYNRVMWGAALRDYVNFAGQAVASNTDGIVLDAGCGSLLFTAQVYLECERPILAFDQSLQMLRRARSRLIKLAGSVPERIFLLQADLRALPFRASRVHTVVCMNVLHHIAEAGILIENLKRLLLKGGHLFLTSLVTSNRLIGNQYLNALYRSGDFVRPRTDLELQNLLAAAFRQSMTHWIRGNMAFAMAKNVNEQPFSKYSENGTTLHTS
jgi:ubiquinone/menaquinone biosynthesis C-methylase UbiE